MLCYLLLNGIYRSYLQSDGYETQRHFFESLTAYCKIQVRMGSGREGGFLPTSCSDARVAETSLNFSVFLPHLGQISPYFWHQPYFHTEGVFLLASSKAPSQ